MTVIAVTIALFGALAFARYDWKGAVDLSEDRAAADLLSAIGAGPVAAAVVQRAGPHHVLADGGLCASGLDHARSCTLVISIQVYSFDPALEEAAFDLGATQWQVFREVTLPVLFPGIFSGGLFAFLLSWGNFPLSLYTTGADYHDPGISLCQDGGRLYARRAGARHRVDASVPPYCCWSAMRSS